MELKIKKASPTFSYTHNLWNGGQHIVRCYNTLKNYVSTIRGAEDQLKLLARPVLLDDVNENIEWYSDRFSSQPKSLLSLNEDEQLKYREILSVQIMRFRSLIDNEQDSDKKNMLRAALAFASEANVYCGDNQVAVVEWGMFPKEVKPIDIYASFQKSKPHPNNGLASNDVLQDLNNTNSKFNGTTDSNQVNEGLSFPDSVINDKVSSKEEYEVDENATLKTDSDTIDGVVDSNRHQSERDISDDAFVKSPTSSEFSAGSNDQFSGDNEKSNLTENSRQQTTPIIDNDSTHGSFNKTDNKVNETGIYNDKNNNVTIHPGKPRKIHVPLWPWIVGGGAISFFCGKNWWWILLILLLMLLFWWLMKSCNDRNSFLPDKPGVMKPIIDDDIVDSPDSTRRIVGDRINVLISDGGTVVEFAKAFKAAYPQNDYQIVYYDELIPRAQIQFPKDKRDELINELPAKLKEFELTLFDESLFENNYKPNDPAFSNKRMSWYFDFIKCYAAWDVTKGNKNIVVAVVDDGFDLNHAELKGKVIKPYNAVTRSSKVVSSMSGHGTHVASTAVGKSDNGQGLSGIAPGCMLMPIQVANSQGLMSTTAVIDGVLYAITQGAQVVNLSLGMSFNETLQMMPVGYQRTMIYNSYLEEERVWNQIFKMAEKHHCTLVLAAGNENVMAGIDPMQRNPLGIKVAAIQPDLKKADFSNYGEFSTVSAPGVDIYNAIPGGIYTFMQGTSMASPIVAGAVALLKSKNSKLTSAQVSYILQSTGLTSPSFVGKIIQLDKALGMADSNLDNIPTPTKPVPGKPAQPPLFPVQPGNGSKPDCEEVRKRAEELERELDHLRRTYPGCLKPQEPLKLDKDLTFKKLNGRWKSSTPVFNTDDELVELYFEFNGTNKAAFSLVEPDGTKFSAILNLSISGDVLTMSQNNPAKSADGRQYNPYHFTCKPDNNRVAECVGINRVEKANRVEFLLLNMN